MQKRVRCPLCGMVVWQSQVNRSHDIDVFEVNRVSREKGSGGFKFNDSQDLSLVALVKSKIKNLYLRFFETETAIVKAVPHIRSSPGFIVGTEQSVSVPATILTKPKIVVVPVVI